MRSSLSVPFAAALIAVGAFLFGGTAAAVPLERITVTAGTRELPGRSAEPAISGDGAVVVFSSTARLAGDGNGRTEVYAKNRESGALELVSDERGGDQPSISADGVFVVYRSLEDLPKVRKFDRRGTGPRNSVSFPFGGGQSRRFGDAGVITPNAAWTAYLFRPEPANTAQTGHLVNLHSSKPGADFDDSQENFASGLRDATRAVATNSGAFVAWVTSEPFGAEDTNEASDVFVSNGVTTRCLSALPGNVSAPAASYDAAFSADGARLVFLSDAALLPTDTDERTSVYFATSADGFTALNYLPTPVRPVALGPQAASAAGTLAFTAAAGAKGTVLFLADFAGASARVTPASAILGAPALSADGSALAFASAAPLVPQDRNKTPDIYVADVSSLLGNAPRAQPVPVFNNLLDEQRIAANQNFAVSAAATDPNGTISELALEVNGELVARVNGGTLVRSINVPVGTHRVTIRAYNDAFVAAEHSVTIVAPPSAGIRGIAGATDVSTSLAADGSLAWAGKVRVENRTAQARNFRVTLMIAPAPAIIGPNETPANGQGFSDVRVLPEREETVGFGSSVVNIAANGSALVEAEAVLPAPEVIGNGLQGIAWSLVAVLTEELAGGPVTLTRQTLLTHSPVLSEKTNGPNGGATNPGAPQTDNTFTPPVITGLTLAVPPRIPEQTTRALKATAVFSNGGTRPCSPRWEIVAGGAAATITTTGVLTARNVNAPATIRLRAELAGVAPVEVNAVVFPVVSAISIAAADKTGAETGDPAKFRITRTGALLEEVTARFTLGGSAVEGADFAPIPREVTLPARVTRSFLEIAPIDNAEFGGLKSITLTLDADPSYRLSPARSATARLLDDDTPLPRQADLVLRAGAKRIGAGMLEAGSPLRPLAQTLRRPARAGATATFFLEATHLGNEAGQFFLRGSPDFSGYVLRYFDGPVDITGEVTSGGADGGYSFAFEPGARKAIKLRVTTTPAAPPGFDQRLQFDLREESAAPANALPDTAELILFRR